MKPSAFERVNVGLAASATHETTCQALRHFSQHKPNCDEFLDTAEFLETVRRWFNICNVKSDFMSHRLNDKDRVALRSNCDDTERSLKFLNEFGNSMRNWHESNVPTTRKMSKDTCMAVFYTSRGLTGLAKYLLECHQSVFQYVLLGKIQSDRIESHFGHLRKLAGSNYWSSVRQFMENEAVIRTKSLIWWSGYSVGELSTKMQICRQERKLEDAQVTEELVEVMTQVDSEELNESTKAALGHIAGYLARSATKNNKCGSCADLLVNRNDSPLEVNFEEDRCEQVEIIYKSFTQLLDRGKLLVPSSIAIDVTLDVCHIWRNIMQEEISRQKLLKCCLPRQVFVDVISIIVGQKPQFTQISCIEGHSLTGGLIQRMAGALFNLFCGNMVRDINSNVHARRKTGGVLPTHGILTRTQCNDKRSKLIGEKL